MKKKKLQIRGQVRFVKYVRFISSCAEIFLNVHSSAITTILVSTLRYTSILKKKNVLHVSGQVRFAECVRFSLAVTRVQ